MTWLINLFSGGLLDRVLDTVDNKVKNETDREKLRSDIIREHYKTRADWMNAGGFILCLLFTVPLAFWFSLVIYDSALGCADCLLANDWTVAALPSPLDEWAGLIIMSIFGVVGVSKFKR